MTIIPAVGGPILPPSAIPSPQSQTPSGEDVFTGSSDKIKIKAPTVRPSQSDVLRYPFNFKIDPQSDYVIFEFFEYMPPFGRGAGESLGTLAENLTAKSGYELYNISGVVGENTTKSKDVDPIIMYMPEDLQSQYGSRWGGADFGTSAVGAMRTFGGKANLDPGLLTSSAAGMVKNTIYNETLKLINEYVSPGSSINLNQMLGAISGTILNPNTEMLYQGQDLRTFSLTFKMTPRTDQEAIAIKKICNRFKKASMPYIGGQALGDQIKAPNLLKVPLVCQVTFMNGNNIHEYLPQYKLCAISGVEVNYTPDGAYATVGRKGSPVSTQLSLNFKETKILFGNDINIEDKGASY